MMTIIHLIELYIVIRVLWKVASFFMTGKFDKRNKGVSKKLYTLASRTINHRLDAMLKKQSEKLGIKAGKVIPLKLKRKSVKA